MRIRSFRQRQRLILILLALVPLTIGAGFMLAGGRNFILNHATQQLETVADLKVIEVEQWLNQGQEVANLVGGLGLFQPGFSQGLSPENEAIQAEIQTINDIFPQVESISLLHPKSGQILLSTDPTKVGRIHSSESYFQAGQKALFLSQVQYSIGLEVPVVIIGVPVRDGRDSLQAVAMVEMDLTDLETILDENAGLPQSGQAYLVETFGFYVTRPETIKDGPLRRKAQSEGVEQAIAGQNGHSVYLNPPGVEVLGVYRWLPEARLGLLVEIETETLTAAINRLWILIMIFALGLLSLAILAAQILTNWLVTPLEKIAAAAQQLEDGDLSHRILVQGPDEIGHLAGAFNKMAHSIQLSYKELEKRVAQRTRKLQTTNEQLEIEIVERKRAEQALAESQARLAEIIDSAMDAIITVDIDYRIILFNAAAERMFGLPAEEALGHSLDRFIPEEFRQVHQNYIQIFGQSGITNRQMGYPEVKGLRANGEIFPMTASISLTEVGGQKLFTAILRDISEQKQIEEALRQAQKMEAIGHLAGGIAHDFNNILVPIIGYAELGMMGLSPQEKLYHDLEQIREAAERAANLTRQILAFSRKQILEMEILDLNESIVDFQKMIQRLISEDIALETQLDPRLYQVKADKAQIDQILLNLVVNARDAMPQGGKLTIETANVYLDENDVKRYMDIQAPGHYAMIALSDTGHGMDAETQTQIFEPFFTTKTREHGTGLGLATVFGIVKQHQGHIEVQSELNQGTTFKICLPQAEVDSLKNDDLKTTETVLTPGTETILVAEDETIVRNLVCETLRAHGYQVFETENVDHCLQLAANYQDKIHLLLTDVIMPGMNGQDLHQELCKFHPDIDVLYMSGYTDSIIENHNILKRGLNFLQKPFTISRLTEKVRQVLDESTSQSKTGSTR